MLGCPPSRRTCLTHFSGVVAQRRDDHADETQNPHMQGIVEMRHILVDAVDRERVLN